MNAKLTMSGMNTALTMRCEIKDLSREDQLALLRTLMMETGTTSAILTMPNGLEISESIGKQWERYEKGPRYGNHGGCENRSVFGA